MKKQHLILLIIFLAALGLIYRLMPHPANFSPIGAITLFAGVYLTRKWFLTVPLGIMLATDLFLGFYEWQTMLAVYACLTLTFFLGKKLSTNKNFINIASAGLAMSVVFFVVTNFTVWAFSSWYPHTWSGLLLNYNLAIPFFRNSLLGDVFFMAALFGGYEFLRHLSFSNKVVFSSKAIRDII
ncbi:MAG: hypothetical protein Q8P32_01160 [Candidatus Komeilibacteria bacterium]|nr:hypothetical protein [Candidatus Komeilibacteria bacterium]